MLDLSGNQLTSLPEWLGKLSGLQVLYLSGNQLTSLPESLGKLSGLQGLFLSGNQLTSLPESLGNLSDLQLLYLSGNQLTSLPESLGKLSALQSLILSDNQLTSLPESLGKLSGLQWLDLSGNQLTSLPESLGKLSGLQELDLSGNQLTSLPAGIRELRALTHLFLHDNPALGLPLEVLGPTFDAVTGGAQEKPAAPAAILDYYFRTRDSARPLNEGKVILVGRGEVGKTSLVNRLTKNEFNEGEDKTQGIQISQWEVRAGADDVRLNVWDFGGQEIMHATHQFFLTERSLYLLVLNGREGAEDQDAEYWLKLIGSFGSESPILVVLNKIDQHPFDLNYRALQLRYPQVHGFVRTDCKTEAGIEELRQRIQSEIDALPGVRAMFPATWFAIKDKLAGMKENFLSYEKFRELCRANNETDEKAQDDLAGFLHCLGIALNYKDDLRLRDTSVLNPHWVTTGIYKLLNAGKLAEHKGVMCMSDLEAWLPAQDYPREKHPFILELMRRFRLCFAFPDDGQNRYLVPELLDKQEPDLQGEFSPKECLNFEYHYRILPEGLLPQFIVRSHILISGTLRWRSGVVLQWEDCRALVKGDMAEKRVVIRVRGGAAEARRRLLAVIRSDFERIHGEIARLEVTAQVPLPDHPEVLRDYDELLTFERARRKRITGQGRRARRAGQSLGPAQRSGLGGVAPQSRYFGHPKACLPAVLQLFPQGRVFTRRTRNSPQAPPTRGSHLHLARPPHPWRRGMGRPYRREPRSRRLHSAAGQCRLHRVGLLLREGNDACP